jgi:hypothetical protein
MAELHQPHRAMASAIQITSKGVQDFVGILILAGGLRPLVSDRPKTGLDVAGKNDIFKKI